METPALIEAINDRKINLVRQLITERVDVNVRYKGWEPIHYAAKLSEKSLPYFRALFASGK